MARPPLPQQTRAEVAFEATMSARWVNGAYVGAAVFCAVEVYGVLATARSCAGIGLAWGWSIFGAALMLFYSLPLAIVGVALGALISANVPRRWIVLLALPAATAAVTWMVIPYGSAQQTCVF
jgi:hypothetical protein